MSTYCQIDDAYSAKITDDVDLDKMAREVNEQKKDAARDIYKNYRDNQTSLTRGITAYNNLNRGSMDSGTEIPHMAKGFFSAQGDYTDLTTMYDENNATGLLISDICKQKVAEQKSKRRKSRRSSGDNTKRQDMKNLRVKKRSPASKTSEMMKNIVANTYYSGTAHDKSLDLSSISNSSESDAMVESDILEAQSAESDFSISSADLTEVGPSDTDTLLSVNYNRESLNTYNNHERHDGQYQQRGGQCNKQRNKRYESHDQRNHANNDLTMQEIYDEIRSASRVPKSRTGHRRKCIDYDLLSADSLESLDSGESLMDHIRDCERCRDHVIGLVRKNKNKKRYGTIRKGASEIPREPSSTNLVNTAINSVDNSANFAIEQYDPNNSARTATAGDEDKTTLELKEILTVCLIGFLVIVILDMTINYRT